MTVFVVQEVLGRNLAPAMKFGKLQLLLGAKTNLMLGTTNVVRELKKHLIDFNDDDYLLLMGDPAAIGLVCAVAAQHNGGKFTVLKWDRQEAMYYPVSIDVHGYSPPKEKLGELHV
jgi:hypothetical protein|tara:strand:+ start:1927 stop:2274 length:348 start_codon:yes stop_codon:yes gene_type:complete